MSELETIRWLNRLEIYGDDITDRLEWMQRLVAVIRSPMGLENLSSHYWCLLAEFVVGLQLFLTLEPCGVGVVESLEEAEDWEKLGSWLVGVWSFLPSPGMPISELMEGIEEATLRSLLRQPSALRGLEDLCEMGSLVYFPEIQTQLQRICDRARAEQLPPESPPPYVSVFPDQCLSILMPPPFLPLQSIGLQPVIYSPSFRGRS